MQEWKKQEWNSREQIAGVENAGVEKLGADRRAGKCRSGKVGSDNWWKAVIKEKRIGLRQSVNIAHEQRQVLSWAGAEQGLMISRRTFLHYNVAGLQ